MSPVRIRLSPLRWLGLVLFAVGGLSRVEAQSYYYWDATSGSSQGGTGTWSNTSSLWVTTAFGTASSTFPGSSFGGTNNANAAGSIAVFTDTVGTVTVSQPNGTVTAGGVWFRQSGYTLAGALTLAPNFATLDGNRYGLIDTDLGTTTITATISSTRLMKQGNGTLVFAGTYTGTGQSFEVVDGVLELASTANLANTRFGLRPGTTLRWGTGAAALSFGQIVTWADDVTLDTNGNDVTLTGFPSFVGGFVKSGSGTLTLANSYVLQEGGNIWVREGALKFEQSGGDISYPFIIGANFTLNATDLIFKNDFLPLNEGYTTFSGTIFGGRSRKEGAGLLVMTGNSEIGTMTIAEGTVQLGNGGTTGSLTNGGQSSAPQVVNNGHLSFKRSNTLTADYQISGTGQVTQDGTGVVILDQTNTYTGGTTVNAGAIQWSNLANFGSGNITLNGGGLRWASGNTADISSRLNAIGVAGTTFDTNGNNVTLASALTGTGSVIKTGSGTLTLSGNNSYAGGTTLSTGTIAVGHSAALGTGSLILNGGALQAATGGSTLSNAITLAADSTISGSQALTLNGVLTLGGFKTLNVTNTAVTILAGGIAESSPSLFIKQGTGELALTGTATYTGGTFIQAGTVRINNSTGSVFGTGAVTVASGATLTGSGSFSGALQLNGTYAPGNSPGTAATGAQTWAGGGAYLWEINDATGAAGANPGWDWMNIAGSLTITATQANPFLIDLTSLTLADVAGDAAHFTAPSYSFTIATASGGISGFSTDKFMLDVTGFTNVGTGTWSLVQSGNNLDLVYATASAVPEPSTYATIAGLAALGLVTWRRRSMR